MADIRLLLLDAPSPISSWGEQRSLTSWTLRNSTAPHLPEKMEAKCYSMTEDMRMQARHGEPGR